MKRRRKGEEEEGGKGWIDTGTERKEGRFTFLDLSLLHLVADLLLQVPFVVVGEFGEVEV